MTVETLVRGCIMVLAMAAVDGGIDRGLFGRPSSELIPAVTNMRRFNANSSKYFRTDQPGERQSFRRGETMRRARPARSWSAAPSRERREKAQLTGGGIIHGKSVRHPTSRHTVRNRLVMVDAPVSLEFPATDVGRGTRARAPRPQSASCNPSP